VSKTICSLVAAVGFLCLASGPAQGADAPKFLGANSCSASSCHGGGGQNQNQFLVWSLKDFHSQRPAATLTTARSKQIAAALDIKTPATDARCTACHAPLHQVPENRCGENFKISEGVSCESCHGPAENWLRAHTRTDWTHVDRTVAGMRDLQNLYVRANTCVACHQNVDSDILAAGHPELIFELDGQSVAEPKHWSAEKNGNGAQAWLVGQAVALREMSWQLYLPKENQVNRFKTWTENQINSYKALTWLVRKASHTIPVSPLLEAGGSGSEMPMADQVALKSSNAVWSDEWTRKLLFAFASSSGEFRDSSISQPLQARRAERLVLALDRLVAALPELKKNEPVQSALNQLFKLAQSIPDFDSTKFAAALADFSRAFALPAPKL